MAEQKVKTKKKMEVPHSLVIILAVMLIVSVLTYIIPAGQYERTTNESGQTVVDPDSFHYVEQTPVNPITILGYVYEGLGDAQGIIFALLCCGGGLGVILSTGMFQGAAGTLGRRVKGREWVVIAVLMTVFALLCVPININTFIPLAPLGLVIASALGLDAIVGISIIMLGGAVGFTCGAMNVSNTGTAQTIAELPIFSGAGFRMLCMIPLLIVAVIYVVRYANKIKEDPSKSFVYGIDLGVSASLENIPEFTKRHVPVAVVFCLGVAAMIYVAMTGSLGNKEVSTIFIYMGLAAGIAYRMKPNQICKEFINGLKGMAGTSMMIGFAYVVAIILNKGNIMDTIVHALAGILSYVPYILQAPAMFAMHTIISLLITSGSGQAATTMPIMVPVADLIGMTRQTACLAYSFGDGFSNNILPHAAATMGFVGAVGIPFSRWFRYAFKLFIIWFFVACALLMVATVIGYS